MREGWEIKTLNEVCKELFAGGDVPKDRSSKFITKEYNIPIFSNGAKNDGLYGYTDTARVCEPSITVSARGTIGYSSIRTKPYLPVVRLIVLIPDKELITLHFLKYVIESIGFSNSGTSIPQLTVPMIKKYNCSIPPLSEQKQIVALLDKAFTAIDQAKSNIEKNIENAKELFQSKLNDIFSHPSTSSGQDGDGWKEKTLGEVASYDKTRYTLADKPYVGLEDIESNSGKFLGNQEAREVKSSTFQFDNRHVLYGRLRPYLNKVLLPEFLGHCSTEIFPILPTKELLREFLFYWFLTPSTVEKIDATWTGARMPRANMNEVIKFSIPIPSIEIQTQTSKQLSILKKNTDNIISNYQSKLDFIEDLKKSILQKAFAGELTSTGSVTNQKAVAL